MATPEELSGLIVVGRVSKKQKSEIAAECRDGELPEFIIGGGMGGSLAAFKDRCLIVKKGLLTSFMASATGGGRAGHFAYTDIVSIEYNSGLLTGALEIHTPAHNAAQSGGLWRMARRKDDSRSPWELPNVLPLDKSDYEKARPYIQRMREMIAQAKRQQGAPAPETDSPDLASQLERLAALKEQGVLSAEEFEAAKRKLIS